jgi:hypothetical protein
MDMAVSRSSLNGDDISCNFAITEPINYSNYTRTSVEYARLKSFFYKNGRSFSESAQKAAAKRQSLRRREGGRPLEVPLW